MCVLYLDQQRRRLVRQDTPMPRHETTPTNGFEDQQHYAVPQVNISPVDDATAREIFTASPTANNDNDGDDDDVPPVLSSSPDSSEDVLSQLDEAIDTLNNTKPAQAEEAATTPKPMTTTFKSRPQSTESMLFCNDFGMNDLMVMIRGAAAMKQQQEQQQMEQQSSRHQYQIRSEISDVFKDSQARLDQLDKVNNTFYLFYICHH